MTEKDRLRRSIEHFIASATMKDLIDMAHQGLEDYFIDNPKESIAFVMEWHPDNPIIHTNESNTGGTECH
tara:strand:+ start:2446 stop:2655 length:210 start_codon:yes stop_codon:yes gene_type:complete